MFEPPPDTDDVIELSPEEAGKLLVANIERAAQVRNLDHLCGCVRVHIADIKSDSQTSPQLTYLADRAEEELRWFDECQTLLRSDGNQHLVASCLIATDEQYREQWPAERLRLLDRFAVAALKLGAVAQLMEAEEFMAHKNWFTSKQVAAYLGPTKGRVSQLVKDGRLRTNGKKRKAMRIDAHSVIEYDRQRKCDELKPTKKSQEDAFKNAEREERRRKRLV